MIESISAITLATHDMARAVRFYRMLGFEVIYGGDDAAFTSFRAGTSYLNLIAQPAERTWSWWGTRHLLTIPDVDALHASVVAAGYRPDRQRHSKNHPDGKFEPVWLKCHFSTPGCTDFTGGTGRDV